MQTPSSPTTPLAAKDQAPGRASSGEPVIRTFPAETRRAPRGWSAWVLGLLGVTAAGLGAGLVWGPSRVPELADLAARASEAGVLPGHLFASGAVLCGLSLLGLYMARVARMILRPGAVEEGLVELGADMAELRNKLYELANEQLHLHSTLNSVRAEVTEHRRKDRSQEAVDALFRLAGSFDTLHAQLDQRMVQSTQGITSTLGELGSLVEASRDYLQDSLEELEQRLVTLERRVTEPEAAPSAPDQADLSQPPTLETPTTETQPAWEPAPPVQPEPEPAPQPPSAGPEESLTGGLGLLDQLDDLGLDEARPVDEAATPEVEPPAFLDLDRPLGALPAEDQDTSASEGTEGAAHDPTRDELIDRLDLDDLGRRPGH